MRKLLLRYARKYETVSVRVMRVIGAYLLDLGVFQTTVGCLNTEFSKVLDSEATITKTA